MADNLFSTRSVGTFLNCHRWCQWDHDGTEEEHWKGHSGVLGQGKTTPFSWISSHLSEVANTILTFVVDQFWSIRLQYRKVRTVPNLLGLHCHWLCECSLLFIGLDDVAVGLTQIRWFTVDIASCAAFIHQGIDFDCFVSVFDDHWYCSQQSCQHLSKLFLTFCRKNPYSVYLFLNMARVRAAKARGVCLRRVRGGFLPGNFWFCHVKWWLLRPISCDAKAFFH